MQIDDELALDGPGASLRNMEIGEGPAVGCVEEKPRILLLFPGPTYFIEEHLRRRLELLSQSFRGVVITSAPSDETFRFGDFDVRSVSFNSHRGPFLLTEFFRTAIRLAGQEGFDLVVTYDPLKIGMVGCMLARKLNAPLIVEVNGDYTSWANYSEIRSPALRAARRALFMGIERSVLRRADAIKLLYPDQVDAFRRSIRNPLSAVIPDFVDLTHFKNLGENPEILLVGFPFHVKGVDVLIAAFRQVADAHPDWTLKILGWYPNPGEILDAACGHPRISLHPPVQHAEVAKHIGRCGIFALPSRTEAMGRVLIEAAACAKPRVATRVGGIPTVVRDGHDGLLVARDDVHELAVALDRLMGDPELRRRLGQNAAERAESEFSANHHYERVAALYHEVLRQRWNA